MTCYRALEFYYMYIRNSITFLPLSVCGLLGVFHWRKHRGQPIWVPRRGRADRREDLLPAWEREREERQHGSSAQGLPWTVTGGARIDSPCWQGGRRCAAGASARNRNLLRPPFPCRLPWSDLPEIPLQPGPCNAWPQNRKPQNVLNTTEPPKSELWC